MMKALLLILLGVHVGSISATAPGEIETQIMIRNIKSPKGFFVISFYNSATDFPKVGKDMHTERIEVLDTLPHTIKVMLPAEGWYAIAMYQDEDSKPKIKQDVIGIPEEPYAFSNNVHPKVEAPGFAACKFYVGKQDNKVMWINLIQPKFHGRL
jgi:uncharacterized protein (DUF2141 family)